MSTSRLSTSSGSRVYKVAVCQTCIVYHASRKIYILHATQRTLGTIAAVTLPLVHHACLTVVAGDKPIKRISAPYSFTKCNHVLTDTP